MAQHDFNIANQGFPGFRADLNNGLEALATNSAGGTEPTTTFAYQFWYDEANDLLKMRNSDNDGWITVASFDQATDEFNILYDASGSDLVATTVQAAIDELDAEKVQKTADTGSAELPVGTTAQRDGTPDAGYIRYNTTINSFEGYDGNAWGSIGGGGEITAGGGLTGGGTGDVTISHADTSSQVSVNNSGSTVIQDVSVDQYGHVTDLNSTTINEYSDTDALDLFNVTGSAPVYACRAWVNFDGTGTVSIRDSGNVSSITDNGTGDYTVNFATAMPDTNYSIVLSSGRNNSNFRGGHFLNLKVDQIGGGPTPTASSIPVQAIAPASNSSSASLEDHGHLFVAVFR